MRAMILAAGLGTRLRPLTNTVPKALVPVAGRPLIEYNLLLLKAYGIEDVVINLHHLGNKIREALGDGSAYGLHITYSPEDPILESGGGIKNAQPFLDGKTFIVVNCDTIVDVDLHALLAAHRQTRSVATLVLRSDSEAASYGLLETDAHGRLRRIRGEPSDIAVTEPLSQYMFTGCQVLEPRVFDFMPEVKPFSTTRETYVAMLRANEPLSGFIHTGTWMTVDDAEAMTHATQAIVSGQVRLSYLRP
jgi:NDP-sugar pyrophosphorylase family protein